MFTLSIVRSLMAVNPILDPQAPLQCGHVCGGSDGLVCSLLVVRSNSSIRAPSLRTLYMYFSVWHKLMLKAAYVEAL